MVIDAEMPTEIFILFFIGIQGRRQLREIGEAKLKSGGQIFCRNAKAFSGRNRKFSDQKPPKKKGLRRNPKAFSGRNRKFQRFFRPKTPT